jgi:shikimate kinase
MWPHSNKPVRLALIGMSGTGKSHWGKNLSALGYSTVCCDDAIEARLAPILQPGGYQGINGVAAWMGWPDRPAYAERESEYLREEIATLDEVLSTLERDPNRELVLDTTGSIICTGNHILHRLRRQMTVVYLAASAEETQLLIDRYLRDPKPVLWQGVFQPCPSETPHDTVVRCYPLLIAARRQSYEALAHLTVPTSTTRELSPPGTCRNPEIAQLFLERISDLAMKHGR